MYDQEKPPGRRVWFSVKSRINPGIAHELDPNCGSSEEMEPIAQQWIAGPLWY
jgi:hypothetical protein